MNDGRDRDLNRWDILDCGKEGNYKMKNTYCDICGDHSSVDEEGRCVYCGSDCVVGDGAWWLFSGKRI